MATPPAEKVVRRVVAAINAHDTKALLGLLAPEHRFVDSLGYAVTGSRALEDAWRGYFQLVPDYRINVDSLLASGQTVALFGSATGSIRAASHESPVPWRVPAAWRAVVVGEFVTDWQVYADNKRVYELLGDSSGDISGQPA